MLCYCMGSLARYVVLCMPACPQVPHYVPWINVLRGGLNAVLAWVALMACILSYTVEWEYDHGHPVWHAEEYRRTMTVVSSRSALCIDKLLAVAALLAWALAQLHDLCLQHLSQSLTLLTDVYAIRLTACCCYRCFCR
jgi:hypothetical protein